MKKLLIFSLLFVFRAEAINQEEAQVQLQKIKVETNTTSLLQYAAAGDISMVKLLLAAGENINAQEPNFGATALHNAAALGHLEMVKWLVENHASIKTQDKQGYTALDWAIEQKKEKVIDYLTQQQKKQAKSTPTILNYTKGQQQKSIKPPQSSFHDWQQAEKEAQSIREQWKNTAITIPWTKLQLQRYIKHKIMPGKSARGLALMHVAMYDALILSNQHQKDPEIAISMAAAQVLSYIFPAEERAFNRTVFSIAAQKYQAKRENLPKQATQAMQIGAQVASQVIQHAQNDGAQRGWNGMRLQWYGQGRYYGPGSWEPTPPYFYYPPEEPYAPTWQTWWLKNGSQFRAPPLPKYGTQEFIKALKEVIEINKTLTNEQLTAAEFWVDGHGTVTPAGHWNQIAMSYSKAADFDDLKTARLYAELNTTLADTYISAWDSKYRYWSIRPVTAAQKLLNIKFKPAILTPPFPSYVSGHAATSGAASFILSKYFPQSAKELKQKGEEAAMSRLYGGIHYRFDNDQGLIQGRKVAGWVHAKFKQINQSK